MHIYKTNRYKYSYNYRYLKIYNLDIYKKISRLMLLSLKIELFNCLFTRKLVCLKVDTLKFQ